MDSRLRGNDGDEGKGRLKQQKPQRGLRLRRDKFLQSARAPAGEGREEDKTVYAAEKVV